MEKKTSAKFRVFELEHLKLSTNLLIKDFLPLTFERFDSLRDSLLETRYFPVI